MNLLDLFDGTKQFTAITVRTMSNRICHPKDMSALDSQLNVTLSSIATGGTDYVQEYVKEEEERMIEDEKVLHTVMAKQGLNFEEISQSTVPPAHHDLMNVELTKIYKTYNFAHRPKENLTITSLETKIISMIETNLITVIQGPTGCGKTTQVPQFILDSCFKKRVHCNIIVTQPRRIAAISIAKRVSQERNWPVGTLVGYRVGMVNNTSQDTRLTYCTTGVLLQKLINTKNMLDYTHVIIDEVHERDQNMDFLLLVVRKLQRTNSRSVKVVLMSATFNVDKFATYFSTPMGGKLVPAPIIDVAKLSYFNVRVHYLCQITTIGQIPEVSFEEPKVSREMMNFCIRILDVFDTIDGDSEHRHAVLVFLPGIWEIEEMHALLTSEANEALNCDVVVLHSSITNDEQQHVFNNPPEGQRRIILATNIAESSITVPDIKYVIDFCLTKQMVTDTKTNFQCLEISWASKANCEQRAGRAGRLMDGRVYRLVPQDFYENVLPEEGSPEMLRAPLENVVLKSKLLDMGEPKAILALSLDPPDLSNLERTILSLKEAGALLDKDEDDLSPLDGNLTDLGRIMAALPVDIHITKLIVLGQIYSVFRDAVIIGASMAVKNVFSAQFQKKLRAYSAKLTWSQNSSSDCISFLQVYNTWMFRKANNRLKTDAAEKRWARSYHLQIRVLREIEALVQDILQRLRRLGISETVGVDRVKWKDDEFPLIIKIVIAGAFYPNYYTRCVNIDETAGIRVLAGYDPTKTVYLTGWPINQPGQLYARRIQDYFQDCVTSKVAKIHVNFDKSTRVYVQFRQNESTEDERNDDTEEPGEISMSVYKAVKLRSIGNPIEIPVMNAVAAEERARELGLEEPRPQSFIPREENIEEIRRPEMGIRPILPALDISYIPLIVSRIITPGHFWARLQDEETSEKIRRIHSIINTRDFDSLKEIETSPKIGSLVLAPRTVNNKIQYFRAVVQNVKVETKTDLMAKVLLIDTGCVLRSRVCDLRRFDDDHEIGTIPAICFECVLAGIRPSVMSFANGQWSATALEKFRNLLSGGISLFGEIYSVVNSVVYLNLIRVDGEKQLNLNEHLVELGFAETKDEDYLSRYNHELRGNNSLLPLRQREHHEKLQYDQGQMPNVYPEPPDITECPTIVRLRGPNSPLEIGLTSLTKAGLGKRVTIDSMSVNSVCLDTNPDDPHERLLIAGSVGQSPSGHSLTLRNTTLMPNIPGLTSLLCLIFAPQMELRRNKMRSRYIGALCGLGYNPATGNSLFPEHDLAINFDVDITMDDLQEINRIRHWMSIGICANPEGDTMQNASETAICQNRVKRALLTLLNKRRKTVSREIDLNFNRWCRYDERLFIPPGKISMPKQYIFRLHNALELDEKNDEREEMIEHIAELRELSVRHYRDDPIGDVICKFCKVTLFGVYQLRIHLNTKDHIEKEEKYAPFK